MRYDFLRSRIDAGTKSEGPLPVSGAQPLDTVCLCGTAPGKTLAVTAGVHGCEYVGVQALRRLAAELDPAELSGNVIFLPLANPTGFVTVYSLISIAVVRPILTVFLVYTFGLGLHGAWIVLTVDQTTRAVCSMLGVQRVFHMRAKS